MACRFRDTSGVNDPGLRLIQLCLQVPSNIDDALHARSTWDRHSSPDPHGPPRSDSDRARLPAEGRRVKRRVAAHGSLSPSSTTSNASSSAGIPVMMSTSTAALSCTRRWYAIIRRGCRVSRQRPSMFGTARAASPTHNRAPRSRNFSRLAELPVPRISLAWTCSRRQVHEPHTGAQFCYRAPAHVFYIR